MPKDDYTNVIIGACAAQIAARAVHRLAAECVWKTVGDVLVEKAAGLGVEQDHVHIDHGAGIAVLVGSGIRARLRT